MKYLSYYLSVIIIICAAATTQAQQVYIENTSNLNYRTLEAYTYNNATTSYGAYIWNSGGDAYTKYGIYGGAYNDGTGDSYGVYSLNNSYGTGKPYAGYFIGSYVSGVPVGYGIYATSQNADDNWAAHLNGKTLVNHADSIPPFLDGTLNVQNTTTSPTYHTASFISNYLGSSDIRGVYAHSVCADGWGYGGEFRGGYRGVYAVAEGGAYASSVYNYFLASGSSTTAGRYGVYGDAYGSTGTPGTGVSSANYGVYSAGAVYGTAYYTSSDRNLKTDIKPLGSSLQKIMALKAYTYKYKHESEVEKAMNLPENEQIGFLAQEVEQVVPQAVATIPVELGARTTDRSDDRTEWIKGIQPDFLLPVLVQAMQEQQGVIEQKDEKIEDLSKEVASLQNRLDALENSLQKMNAAMQNCCLSDKTETGSLINDGNSNNYSNAARLEQNAPNPFYAKTIIQHYVPEEANSAQLQITALDGKVIKSINLSKGFSTTTINGSELAAGTYIYALIIDGKNTAAKEMILTK